MIHGGRFLASTYEGTMAGKPFHGRGLMGYDNAKKRYVATWIDTISTGIMYSEGTVDAAGKVFTMLSEQKDPVSGKTEKMKEVTTIVDADTHRHEMYVLTDGQEFKTLDITYRRVKK